MSTSGTMGPPPAVNRQSAPPPGPTRMLNTGVPPELAGFARNIGGIRGILGNAATAAVVAGRRFDNPTPMRAPPQQIQPPSYDMLNQYIISMQAGAGLNQRPYK